MPSLANPASFATSNAALVADAQKRNRRTQPQPLTVLDVPDALLTVATVSALTSFSASTLYRLAQRGELVPVRRGIRCTRWRAGDVSAYLAAQAVGAEK